MENIERHSDHLCILADAKSSWIIAHTSRIQILGFKCGVRFTMRVRSAPD